MAHPTAAQRVFAITELIEQIFLELPARHTLVNIQRVCRSWKEVVDGSSQLQQALFFQPITNTRVKSPLVIAQNTILGIPVWHGPIGLDIVLHPLAGPSRSWADHLQNRQIFFSSTKICNITSETSVRDQQASWLWKSCTTIFTTLATLVPTWLLSPSSVPNKKEYTFTPCPDPVSYRNASWHRQLCSQPPATQVRTCHCIDTGKRHLVYSNGAGVTMGQIMTVQRQYYTQYKKMNLHDSDKGYFYDWNDQSAKDFVLSVEANDKAFWADQKSALPNRPPGSIFVQRLQVNGKH